MIELRLARSFSDKCQAWHLVHRQYVSRNLSCPHPSRMVFTALDLLPTSVTCIAGHNQRIVGTMSAVVSPVGALPSGDKFESDLKEFGVDGRIVCEFTKLACSDDAGGSQDQSALWMMAYLLSWCKRNGIDDAFCVTNPRHAAAWVRIFSWVPISAIKSCSHVNDAPGVLLHLDIQKLFSGEATLSSRGNKMLQTCTELTALEPPSYRLTGSELSLLMLQMPEVFASATPAQKNLLNRYYPWATDLISDYLTVHRQPWRPFAPNPANKPHRELPLRIGQQSLEQQNASQLGNLRFLVVDDDLSSQRFIHKLLGYKRHVCYLVRDAKAASTDMNHGTFDVILFNDRKNIEQSSSFADRIREQDDKLKRHTPIISIKNNSAEEAGFSRIQGLRTQWPFEYQSVTVLLRVIDLLTSAPANKNYSQYLTALTNYPKRIILEAEERKIA